MTQWEEIRRRPVLPFYLAALVWPVAGLLLPLYQLWALALTIVCSAAVGLVAARLCPARIVRREVPYTTGSEDADAMIAGITADLDRLRALNLDIPDKDLSALMDRMEKAGRGIVSELQHDPDKAKQVDRFARYYLPKRARSWPPTPACRTWTAKTPVRSSRRCSTPPVRSPRRLKTSSTRSMAPRRSI